MAGSLIIIISRIKKKNKVSKTQYDKPSSSINEPPTSNTENEKIEIQKKSY